MAVEKEIKRQSKKTKAAKAGAAKVGAAKPGKSAARAKIKKAAKLGKSGGFWILP